MESMTSFERIEAATRLAKPDRVPVVPLVDVFSSTYGGITQHEMIFDIRKADAALGRTIRDLGTIDGQHASVAGTGRVMSLLFPVPSKLPGVDGVPPDAHWQFVEHPVVEPEEYQRIVEMGAGRWMLKNLWGNHAELRTIPGFLKASTALAADGLLLRRSVKAWRRKGIETMIGPNLFFPPLEWIALTLRSFKDFILDIYRYPEEVKAACRAFVKPLASMAHLAVRLTGVGRVFIFGGRTSASVLSPRQFEEFALPGLEEMCEYFVKRGITPLLHFDSNWTPFFHFLKVLPARKCILNLDGTSDIFQAKEVLGDHMCIMGDVPAVMMKLGDPEEVDEYCRRLITEIGSDGGFILSSGCTVPVDARPENVKAMLESVKKYKA